MAAKIEIIAESADPGMGRHISTPDTYVRICGAPHIPMMVSFLYYFGVTRMRVGFGSAVGDVLFVVCVAFAWGYRRWVMRDD